MKKYGLQLITIFLTLTLAVLLVISSKYFIDDNNSSGTNSGFATITPSASSDNESSGNNSANVDGAHADTSIITADPAKLIDTTGSNPHSGLFDTITTGTKITTQGISYTNYNNGFSLCKSDLGELSFQSDGTISFTALDGSSSMFTIADYIDLSEYFSGDSMTADADWFFVGAFTTDTYVYVQYDYWGKDELSLYIRMKKDGSDISLVYASFYDSPELNNTFTVTNELMYYAYCTYDTETGAVESSLMQAALDGNDSGILFSFPDGYSLHHLVPCDTYLLFMLTDTEGTTSLLRMNTETLELAYLSEDCPVTDSLTCFDHYAYAGITSSSTAVIYDIYQGTGSDITISTSLSNQKFGQPIVDQEHCYLPVFTWDNTSPTAYVELYPETGECSSLNKLSDSFYYLVGISDAEFYAESGDTYIIFPLQQH